jgi:hypothetical protein
MVPECWTWDTTFCALGTTCCCPPGSTFTNMSLPSVPSRLAPPFLAP